MQSKIRINEFTLSYYGIYIIEFEYKNRRYKFNFYLPLFDLFKIIQNENLDVENFKEDFDFRHTFTKTILEFDIFEEKNEKVVFINSELGEYCEEQYNIQLVDAKIVD